MMGNNIQRTSESQYLDKLEHGSGRVPPFLVSIGRYLSSSLDPASRHKAVT